MDVTWPPPRNRVPGGHRLVGARNRQTILLAGGAWKWPSISSQLKRL